MLKNKKKEVKTIKLYEAIFFGAMAMLLVYLFMEIVFK